MANLQTVVLIAHNLRSCHNVGSLLRTCDGLGTNIFIATGTTPYPEINDDKRLPHIKLKQTKQISKTALGAEKTMTIEATEIYLILEKLRGESYLVCGLEQTEASLDIRNFRTSHKNIALVVGNEVKGIESEVLKLCDILVEIPMFGSKESFNVTVAAAIGLWQLMQSNQS